jgi:hypothetical protein
MTLFYSHQDRLDDATGGSLLRALAHLVINRASAAFTCIHQAIVTARARRMQRELMFHDCSHDGWSPELDARESNDRGKDAAKLDAAKFPQQPLILGDKWDF